jgi:hypothetical protein
MFDNIPIWALFLGVLAAVLLSMEVGYGLLKWRTNRKKTEDPGMVSMLAGAGVGLLGFVLAFAFSIVYGRYEIRKELVRQEANAIRRIWLRSGFMGQSDRSRTVDLLKQYVDTRLQVAEAKRPEDIDRAVSQSEGIQHQLWEQGVEMAKTNSLSGMNVPYLQSLIDLTDIHSQRLAIGARDRIPAGIWVALGAMLLLTMTTIGYLSGIKDTGRSPAIMILALSISLLFVLVSALDDPLHGMFKASQQPLVAVKNLIEK